MDWLRNLTLGKLVDNWKTVVVVVTAVIAFVSGVVKTAFIIDERWVKAPVYAADMADVRGTVNYHANERKRDNARDRLEAVEERLAAFELKPAAERFSQTGIEYKRVLEERRRDARRDLKTYEDALKNDAAKGR